MALQGRIAGENGFVRGGKSVGVLSCFAVLCAVVF